MLDYMETHDVTDDYGNRLYSVTTVQPVMPNYDTRTSTDRIDELNREMAALRAEFRALSAAMLAGDVPFGTLRMAEDAWSTGG